MKSKIASFIITFMIILMIGILCFLGIIVYNKLIKINIVNEVADFTSNITISGESKKEDIKTPEIIEIESTSSGQESENIDYSNKEIDKFFYNQLNKYSKIIYNAIDINKENMKTGTYEINMGTEFTELFSQSNGEELLGEYYQSAIEAYTYDNPDVFYIEFSKL